MENTDDEMFEGMKLGDDGFLPIGGDPDTQVAIDTYNDDSLEMRIGGSR